ncbi:toxin-antitoxin system HicB family antitoxin [Streptomyces sp. NPDC087440]|uniref:toxin-antitoxin system HicB family antitoxin n=1 Tax=Streptomyces sp. NPDC087440 TaxID=3365790 RepID=UPI00382D2896
MTTKTQFNVRMSADAVAAAKLAAAAERISLNEYIERLVTADTDVKRAASLEYAEQFLDEWGDFIESEVARHARG